VNISFDLTQWLITSGITASALLVFIWKNREKILNAFYAFVMSRYSKNIEKNAKIIANVYDEMQDVMHSSPLISNVIITKFHNGVSKITVHSNINQTVTHELNTCDAMSIKEYIQNIPCDASTIDLVIKAFSTYKMDGYHVDVDKNPHSLNSSVLYDLAKIKSTYNYCLYADDRHILLLRVCYRETVDKVPNNDIAKAMYGAYKIKNILNKRRI